jgi:hypothetical protein
MLTIFYIKGSVHKALFLPSQTVNSHTTLAFYGNGVKMCEGFVPKLGDK